MRTLALAALLASPALAAAPDVRMYEYIVARGHETPELRSYGFATCVALALYSPSTKIGMLAHFGPLAEVRPSVDHILRAMTGAGANFEDMRGWLSGGWAKFPEGYADDASSTSPQIAEEIEKALARYARKIPLERQDLLIEPRMSGGPEAVRSYALDLRAGRFSKIAAAPSAELDRAAQREYHQRTRLMAPHPHSLDPLPR